MIHYATKPLFSSAADALVNPVNCSGYLGKGLALEFKRRFPECVEPYNAACSAGWLRPGRVIFIRLLVNPVFKNFQDRPGIILFPTKDNWRQRSKLEWIEEGVTDLVRQYRFWGVSSIAMPQIGCGLGGLDWSAVKPILERALMKEPIDVEVCMHDMTAGSKQTRENQRRSN